MYYGAHFYAMKNIVIIDLHDNDMINLIQASKLSPGYGLIQILCYIQITIFFGTKKTQFT